MGYSCNAADRVPTRSTLPTWLASRRSKSDSAGALDVPVVADADAAKSEDVSSLSRPNHSEVGSSEARAIPPTSDAAPVAEQDQEFTCDRCDGHRYLDNPIHGGRSTRRDCATCGRTWGFPVWNPPGRFESTSVAARTNTEVSE